MLKSYSKKLAIIKSIFILVNNNKENLEKKSIIWDLKIIKYIILNVKLNKNNMKVFVLFDLSGKANLIFQACTI